MARWDEDGDTVRITYGEDGRAPLTKTFRPRLGVSKLLAALGFKLTHAEE